MFFLRSLLVLVGVCVALGSIAEDRYIEDTVFVPLRSGASTEHRILHQGIPGGTTVSVIQSDPANGWSEVRTRDGIEGWLPSRYLKREPGARYQLQNALRLLGQPDDGSVSIATAIEKLLQSTNASNLESLQTEITELRETANSATALDENNRALSENVQMLKNRISVLEAENLRLKDQAWQQWFINGVWATGVGGLLTLLLPRLIPQRRRRSEWT